MEQRIDALEEELKVLKNQVKAVLLDIKEYLATGNGQAFAPVAESGSPVPQVSPVGSQPMGSGGNQTVIDLRQGARPEATQVAAPEIVQGPSTSEGHHEYAGPTGEANLRPQQCYFAIPSAHGEPDRGPDQQWRSQAHDAGHDERKSEGAQTAETSARAIAGQDAAPVVDLLTVSVVAQWMSRATEAVGKDQIDKLVEIYDITSSLPPGLKETMLLLSELYGGGGESDTPSDERRQVPATVSVQLLIELDSLLRYRQGALESVVFSMLVDRGLGAGNNGHG